jgi:phosphoglycolate phosphatase
MLRAVLLDLDGTLVDSLPDLAAAANRVLAELGAPAHAAADYRGFIGRGVAVLMERALPPGSSPEMVQRAVELMREDYSRSWAVATRPYAGVQDMLDSMRRAGLSLAVLSNKPHEFTEQFAEAFFPAGTFDHVLGASPDRPHKPDPAPALELARRLEADPAECALLGDSAVDALTARAAGMAAVGALWGYRGKGELLEAGAEYLAESPAEAKRILLELAGHELA